MATEGQNDLLAQQIERSQQYQCSQLTALLEEVKATSWHSSEGRRYSFDPEPPDASEELQRMFSGVGEWSFSPLLAALKTDESGKVVGHLEAKFDEVRREFEITEGLD